MTPAPRSMLLLGGARSGKSTLAIDLAERWQRSASSRAVTFVATATAGDDDMARRIDRHRGERPTAWATIEEPTQLVVALKAAPTADLVIVDCLTMWTANLGEIPESELLTRATAAGSAIADRTGPTIVISNEVGLGVVPPTELGRSYRDRLGRVNQVMARHLDETRLLVAGRTLRLDPTADLAIGDLRPDESDQP